jgi:outer membrane biosynthesis protein TonB
VTTSISERRQAVEAIIAEAEEQLNSLKKDLGEVNRELDNLSEERQQYQLLDDICSSLDKLGEMGAAELFWGAGNAGPEQERQLEHVRSNVTEFQQQISKIDESKQSLQKQIDEQATNIDYLHDDLAEILEQEERAKHDYVVEREARELPYRQIIMPWTKQGDDERRFRKVLVLVFLFVFAMNGLISVWELPERDNEVVEIPEHLVKLVKKQKPKPKPPEKKPKKKEDKKEEKKDQKKQAKNKPKPTPAETKAARQKAATSGVLAFSDSFSDLLSDDVDAKLGASASLSNKGSKSKSDSSRSLIMAQAKGGSGGISNASVSRGVGGGAGKRIGSGVSFARVESAIGTDMIADDRPLSDGVGPSRTDEEIQIVFDRYKAALYRIYNRELRKNPTLRGKMVLRITIEPDGSVSAAKVESTDMNSPELSSKIVARVKRFNFGPKDGVPKTTILYPIDFLPAS